MWSALSPVSPTDSYTFCLICAAFAAALLHLFTMLTTNSFIPNFIRASRAATEFRFALWPVPPKMLGGGKIRSWCVSYLAKREDRYSYHPITHLITHAHLHHDVVPSFHRMVAYRLSNAAAIKSVWSNISSARPAWKRSFVVVSIRAPRPNADLII